MRARAARGSGPRPPDWPPDALPGQRGKPSEGIVLNTLARRPGRAGGGGEGPRRACRFPASGARFVRADLRGRGRRRRHRRMAGRRRGKPLYRGLLPPSREREAGVRPSSPAGRFETLVPLRLRPAAGPHAGKRQWLRLVTGGGRVQALHQRRWRRLAPASRSPRRACRDPWPGSGSSASRSRRSDRSSSRSFSRAGARRPVLRAARRGAAAGGHGPGLPEAGGVAGLGERIASGRRVAAGSGGVRACCGRLISGTRRIFAQPLVNSACSRRCSNNRRGWRASRLARFMEDWSWCARPRSGRPWTG